MKFVFRRMGALEQPCWRIDLSRNCRFGLQQHAGAQCGQRAYRLPAQHHRQTKPSNSCFNFEEFLNFNFLKFT